MWFKQSILFVLLASFHPSVSQNWAKTAGLDCYEGKGGDPIQPDPYSTNLSLEQCRYACNQDSQCQGVIRKAADQQGQGVCYKRTNLQIGSCVQDSVWDLHQKTSNSPDTKSGWQKKTGVDCYENQGGDPILPDPYSDSVTLGQCKAACETDSSCQGIIRRAAEGQGSGICYKRKNIVLVRCVGDPVWDLHLKQGSGGEPAPTGRPTTQRPTTRKPVTNNKWQTQTGFDCYQGRGGDPILPDPYSSSVSLTQCQAACDSDSSCQGIIRRAADGQGSGVCYRRKNIVLSRCVRDTAWNLHMKPGSGGNNKVSVTEKIRQKIAEKPVFIVSMTYCPYCVQAKDVLKNYNINPKFIEIIEIENDPNRNEIQNYMMQLTGGRTVPRVFIGGKFLGGAAETVAAHRAGRLGQMLRDAGAI